MLKNSLLSIFVLLVFFPKISYGETTPITKSIPELNEQIYVNLSNDFPKPEELVKISLEAYGTDLNKANITWKVNGVTEKIGIGETSFSVVAPKIGATKKISVTIETYKGLPINKTVTLSPQEVDLVWEARTYTPPFYKGKAMYAPQENIAIVAITNFIDANGAQMDRSKLIYKWDSDGEAVQDQSGYNKDTFKMKGSILLKENSIGIEVTGFGKEKAKNSVDLKLIFPEIVFYENSPIYGILFNRALNQGFSFSEEEKTLEAFPYSFGAWRKNDTKLTYEWRINNKKIYVPSTQNNMVFRNTKKETGTSLIGVTVRNSENFLEEANGSVNLNFQSGNKEF